MPFVYIVRCADGTLYTGWTTDVDAPRRPAQRWPRRALHTHAPAGNARLP